MIKYNALAGAMSQIGRLLGPVTGTTAYDFAEHAIPGSGPAATLLLIWVVTTLPLIIQIPYFKVLYGSWSDPPPDAPKAAVAPSVLEEDLELFDEGPLIVVARHEVEDEAASGEHRHHQPKYGSYRDGV